MRMAQRSSILEDELLKHALIPFFTALLLSLLVITASAGDAILSGDVDLDGMVTSADARIVLRYSVGLDALTQKGLIAADTDQNGSVAADDARQTLRYAVGLDVLVWRQTAAATTQTADTTQQPTTAPSSDTTAATAATAATETTSEPSSDTGLPLELTQTVTAPAEDAAITAPAAPTVTADHDTFTFITYGYGHAVGLSQYTAVHFAQCGMNYRDILAYFYHGTTLCVEAMPAESVYPDGSGGEMVSVPTSELLARMVQQEIGGITTDPEALKAQAVAIYSNLKRYDYNVTQKYYVAYAVSSYSKCSEAVKSACAAVAGQYLTYNGSVINAVYSALTAGSTCESQSVWGGSLPYLSAVKTTYDLTVPSLIKTKTFTADELRAMINAYDPKIVLPEDKSQWIRILSTDGCIDGTRGYVTQLLVGDRVFTGSQVYNRFFCSLMGYSLRSHAFTVVYTA